MARLTRRSDDICTALKLSSSFQVGCWNPAARPVRFTCQARALVAPWAWSYVVHQHSCPLCCRLEMDMESINECTASMLPAA